MTSNLSAFPYFYEREEATPAAFNDKLSIISGNIAAVASQLTISPPSGNTVSISTNLNVVGGAHFQFLSVGSTPPSYVTTAAVTIEVNSAFSDYLYLVDSAAQKSSYVIGSRAGGTADGLNIWDASAGTMIASFSKQSIRFFQSVVGPVFDVGGALADTLNAATFGTGADSVESRIQAAISAATIAGITHVYIPASMYPYSGASISHDTRVKMVREGGDWTVFDIIAYGANGNGSSGSAVANQAAIQSAISAANWDPNKNGIRGGTVYIPTGQYQFSGQITVPIAVNQGQVILRGSNMRASILMPTTSGGTSVLFGSPLPDLTPSSTSITQFGAIEDLEIVGTQVGANTCAVQWTEMQKGWISNVIITGFSAAGCIGLYLRGSTGNSAPHSWRGGFYNLVIASTYRPLVVQNGDENDFFNCNFGLPTGLASAVTAVEILQGNSNRFFGTTLNGEVSSLTTGRINYTGFKLSATTGNTSNNQCYGIWVEGFDSGVSIASGVSNNAFYSVNPSIDSATITDAGQSTIWIETANLAVPLYQYPDGTAAGPSYAFHSEGSLGWYRSATSIMALSPTGRLGVGSGAAFFTAGTPELTFTADTDSGIFRSGANQWDFTAGGTRAGRVVLSGDIGQLNFETGSSTTPGIGLTAEPRLGWWKSAASTMALSYGTLTATLIQVGGSFYLGSMSGALRLQGQGAGLGVLGSNNGFAPISGSSFLANVGAVAGPSFTWTSDLSTGFYFVAPQTIIQSRGTLNLATNAVRLSMRTLAASSVTASAAKTNVAVDEVVFTVGASSGATLLIYSGGTVYGFNSTFSVPAA